LWGGSAQKDDLDRQAQTVFLEHSIAHLAEPKAQTKLKYPFYESNSIKSGLLCLDFQGLSSGPDPSDPEESSDCLLYCDWKPGADPDPFPVG
jgi:hypothetical protein